MNVAKAERGLAAAGLILGLALGSGCANRPPPPPPWAPVDIADVLSGAPLFGEPLAVPAADTGPILAPSEAMRQFVNDRIGDTYGSARRLRLLISGMLASGHLAVDYQHQLTLSAAQTFEQKAGNCLSYTNLFVSLARLAGLSVSYQLVEIPPVWNAQGDWVVLDRHINVLVRRGGGDSRAWSDQVVDFNIEDYQGNYPARQISDEEAHALYFNNLGVAAMQAQDARGAFIHFRQALQLGPRLSAAWINLGALYARHGHEREAAAAYHQALEQAPGDKSALSNLSRLHRRLGHEALARHFDQQVERHRLSNPYYHYQRALQAYEADDLEAALASLRQALKRKSDEHQFHFLRARIALRQDDLRQVEDSLRLARDSASQGSLQRRYASKIAILQGEAGAREPAP